MAAGGEFKPAAAQSGRSLARPSLGHDDHGRAQQPTVQEIALLHHRDDGAGLHALRRSWATAALNAGASFPAVQAAGGWASPQVLLAHYARSTEDAQHELAMGVGTRLLEG